MVCWRSQWDPCIRCVKCGLQPMMRWLFDLPAWSGCALPVQPSRSVSVLLQTLGLPRDIFQIVLAKAAQQHGTASSLRLTSRSLAHVCGAALVTGETARLALIFPPSRKYVMLVCSPSSFKGELLCLQTAGTIYLESPKTESPVQSSVSALAVASGRPPARLPQQHPKTGRCDLDS